MKSPDFPLLAPWELVDKDMAKRFEDELKKELRHDHILSGSTFEAVAASTMTDDVLFTTDSEHGILALVHLTWSGKPDQYAAWPSTSFYDSWATFRDSEMIPMRENSK